MLMIIIILHKLTIRLLLWRFNLIEGVKPNGRKKGEIISLFLEKVHKFFLAESVWLLLAIVVLFLIITCMYTRIITIEKREEKMN